MEEATFKKINNQFEFLKLALKVKAPFLPANLQFDSEYNKNLLKYNMELKYAKNTISNDMEGHFNNKEAGDYKIVFGLALNNNKLNYVGSHDIADGKSEFANKIESSTGANMELNGHVRHGMSADNVDIGMDGKFSAGAGGDTFT